MTEWKEEGFPVIETEKLVLRKLLLEDAAILYQYWSDLDVTEYLTLEPFANIQEAIAMIELLNGLPASKQGIRWAITRKEDNKVLGTCGYHNVKPEHSRAEIGYELGKEFWSRGVMKESLTAVLNYGFNQMKYNRVEAFVNRGNSKSTKILAKLGFCLEGLLREYEFACGKFVDQYCYSLLKSDYEPTFRNYQR